MTARMLAALLANLHADELDLPIIICTCWNDEEQVSADWAEVTQTEITLHRTNGGNTKVL